MPLIIPATQTLVSGVFSIDNSCRFNDDDAPYLARTPSSTGNQKTYTYSYWFKIGNPAAGNFHLFNRHTSGEGGGRYLLIEFKTDDTMRLLSGDSATLTDPTTTSMQLITTRVFRDVSSWYHFVIAVDTTQGTASNRVKLYVNGVQETSFGTETYPDADDIHFINHTNTTMEIGGASTWSGTQNKADGYMAELHFVDGTALTPSSFGESGDYGEWKPIEVSGLTYGTNGFYLDFADASDLGDDESGNGNDFAETNITASDQMLDSPTNNFCVFNPLDNYYGGHTYAEGNLKVTTGLPSYARVNGTIGVSSGKWYFEMREVTKAQYNNDGGNYMAVGISEREATAGGTDANQHPGASSDSYGYYSTDGSKLNNAPGGVGRVSYGDSYTEGDIVGVAFDLDNHKIYFSKNGTWQDSGDPTSGATGTGAAFSLGTGRTYRPSFSDISGHATGPAGVCVFNFGQDGTFAGAITAGGNADDNGYGNFKYDVPASYLALNTKNLPDCAITPSEHFNTVLYTDNASIRSITGVGFQPDLVWIKTRNHANYHNLFDPLRGVGKTLHSSTNGAEDTATDTLTSFDSDGFGLGADASGYGVNYDNKNEVAWCWKANGSGSSNEDGSINTTATSANTANGFSISTYTGNGTGGATVGHGLSKAPELVIIKNRSDSSTGWPVGSIQSMGSMDFTDYMDLDATTAVTDEAALFHDTAPTSSVVTISTGTWVNINTKSYVMYCWHSVDGFSKIGQYTGNGNADGTFVYCGFRPAYIMTKAMDSTSSWFIFDNKRGGYNVDNEPLFADVTTVEGTTDYIDILSNGFKSRIATDPNVAEAYLYIAFAEIPFKNTNAR